MAKQDPKTTAPALQSNIIGAQSEPTAAEKEEASIERANSLNLEAENQLLKNQAAQLMARLERLEARQEGHAVDPKEDTTLQGETPVLDLTEPHGIVVGDTAVAFVQNGHQFGRDRQYLATEKHRGSPKAFRPHLVGVLTPRVAQVP